MKKKYIAPSIEVMQYETEEMIAASIDISRNERVETGEVLSTGPEYDFNVWGGDEE